MEEEPEGSQLNLFNQLERGKITINYFSGTLEELESIVNHSNLLFNLPPLNPYSTKRNIRIIFGNGSGRRTYMASEFRTTNGTDISLGNSSRYALEDIRNLESRE